jgi:nitroimidazol reductase NimA-like FMN-containing flavoprotein (pyridoxamine 5'-phosphate oxidase superfamily)
MTDAKTATGPLVPLSREECLTLLRSRPVGRLALVVEGRPHVIPINFAADDDGVVVFRTSDLSIANDASLASVAFEVDDIDLAAHEGWSVVVHGRGREIGDAVDAESRRLRSLAAEPWAKGPRERCYKVTPDEITGRRLRHGGAS